MNGELWAADSRHNKKTGGILPPVSGLINNVLHRIHFKAAIPLSLRNPFRFVRFPAEPYNFFLSLCCQFLLGTNQRTQPFRQQSGIKGFLERLIDTRPVKTRNTSIVRQ